MAGNLNVVAANVGAANVVRRTLILLDDENVCGKTLDPLKIIRIREKHQAIKRREAKAQRKLEKGFYAFCVVNGNIVSSRKQLEGGNTKSRKGFMDCPRTYWKK